MNSKNANGILLSLIAATVLAAGRSHARVNADRAAAIVTYPLIRVDPTAGVDTFVQLANAGAAPVDVECFLENHNAHCSVATGTVCRSLADCPAGESCEPDMQVTSFQIGLTARQPISWQALGGRAALPLPNNTGAIPAVPELPFIGVLRCVAVNAAGAPSESNVLTGEATLERYDGAAPLLDAAKYNALGLAALPGTGDGNGELVLGGPLAEYEGCPNLLTMNFFTDHGIEPATGLDQILNELTLTPCTSSLHDGDPSLGAAVAQFLVYNEFEQTFSTSRIVSGQLVSQMSLIDTSDSSRSIFSAGVIGTLAGRTRVSAFNRGLVGVAIEKHHRLAAPQSFASAGFNLHGVGERSEADVLRTEPPTLCSLSARSNCRTAGRSSLTLIDRGDDHGDRILWRFQRGAETSTADFGLPPSGTNYGICIYAGAEEIRRSVMEIPASPSWTATAKGFRYSDPEAAVAGVRRILLRSGARSAIQVRGHGEALPDFALGSLTAPVLIQLVNDGNGTCWESSFDAGDIGENTAQRFEASGGD